MSSNDPQVGYFSTYSDSHGESHSLLEETDNNSELNTVSDDNSCGTLDSYIRRNVTTNDYSETLPSSYSSAAKSDDDDVINTDKPEDMIEKLTEHSVLNKAFLRIRIFMCLFAGLLIRLSFLTSFGNEYVQVILFHRVTFD